MRQTNFGFLKDYKKEFGGSSLVGKRKTLRPLSTKAPIYLILKSDLKGTFSPSNSSLKKLIHKTADQFHIQVYDLAINWSHIHFLIRIRSRQDYNAFVRALTSLIAQGVSKSRPNLGKVFTIRPFTRILSWGRDLKGVVQYIVINQMEAFGLIKRDTSQRRRIFEIQKSKSPTFQNGLSSKRGTCSRFG